jgi:Protein of unknown function (DUF1573)
MKLYHWFLLLLTATCAQTALAQDIRLLLQRLTPEQKKQVLSYIQSQQQDIDQEIICAFNQLKGDGQQRTVKYLEAIQPKADGRPQRTTVSWDRDTFFFGALDEGLTLYDSFRVTNTGTQPYLITTHQTACDCAVLSVPEQPLLPGESAVVRFELNTLGKAGQVHTGIVIHDNSSPNARTILYLSGEVRSRQVRKKKPWE